MIVQNVSHKKVLKSFPKNSNVLNISAEPKKFGTEKYSHVSNNLIVPQNISKNL